MKQFQSLRNTLAENTPLYFRGVLFLTFFGHGLASLGLSHHGYELHQRIFESVNFFQWKAETFLLIQGWSDIFLAVAVLSGFAPRVILPLALSYLCTVAGVAYIYYNSRTGSWFGIGEIARRFAWIFYVIFLLIYAVKREQRFSLLRIGIAFGFLSHGITSLGFFGMRGGQMELATQIFSKELASTLVFYSGFSDITIGTLLLLGIYSQKAAVLGSCWLLMVTVLSFMLGIPEGLFRSAFLLSCCYVALDPRCHSFLFKNGSEK